eukprot:4093345-Pyramimonas_sp.AAC.1
MALANARDATTSRNNDVNVQRKWTGVIYPIKTKWTYSGSYRKPLRTSIHKPQPRLCPKEATHRVYRNPHKIEPAWTGTGVLRCVTTESPHALIQKTYHRCCRSTTLMAGAAGVGAGAGACAATGAWQGGAAWNAGAC